MFNPATIDKFSDPALERIVLASVLKNAMLTSDLLAEFKGENPFLIPLHKQIFNLIKNLHNKDFKSFDLENIVGEATRLNLLDVSKNYNYLESLLLIDVDYNNFSKYLSKLLDVFLKYKLREVLSTELQDIDRMSIEEPDFNASDLFSKVESKLLSFSLDAKFSDSDSIDFSSVVNTYIKNRIDNPQDLLGISSGFSNLDECIYGLEPGKLTVFCARPSVGKSTILLNVGANCVYNSDDDGVVVYIDTEMSWDQQMSRLLSYLSGVPEYDIKSGKFTLRDDAYNNVMKAVNVISGGKFLHHTYVNSNVEGLISIIKSYHHKYKIKLVIFDYIKITMSAVSRFNAHIKDNQYLALLVSSLKDLSRILNIPILSAAQLNREADNKDGAAGSHIYGTDAILQFSDYVFALMPKSKTRVEEEGGWKNSGTHFLRVLKNRFGVSKDLSFIFDKSILSFFVAPIDNTNIKPTLIQEPSTFEF